MLLNLIFSAHVSTKTVNIMPTLLAPVIKVWFQGPRFCRQVKAHRCKGWDLIMNLPVEGLKDKHCLRNVHLDLLPQEVSSLFSL